MKIAVIGAGIFGATTAIKLAQAGFAVDLYEREPDILQAASGINQYRLHRGYHYPRSADTALSSKLAESSFREEYGEAVMDHYDHYYCIARDGSKVTAQEFRDFCIACDLEHDEASLDHFHNHMVDFTIRGRESIIDPIKLREIVRQRIEAEEINLLLHRLFAEDDIENYDLIVNASYANLNAILGKNSPRLKESISSRCVRSSYLNSQRNSAIRVSSS
jgi:glycine/D-amino acid oxidase-like deaminating enzyme